MAQHGFGQMGAGNSGIDPNDLLGGSFNPSSFQNFGSGQNNHSSAFSSGSALISDDDLFDTLAGSGPTDTQSGLPSSHDFSGMSSIPIGGGYSQSMFSAQQGGLSLDQSHINGYSNTPDGDPIQSPFVNGSMSHYRSIQPPQAFGSLQSPNGYTGSPLAAADFNNDHAEPAYIKSRSRLSQSMPRKTQTARSPLPAKVSSSIVTAIPAPSSDSFVGSAQPIRTNGSNHEKSSSGQWAQTPNSLSSFPGSGFSSPMQPGGMHSAQINEMLLKGGTSMPAKLGGPMTTSQEAKRKRRRESHNLVERRRRDNINERIQDLSKLVPSHRLDDERIKKIVSSGTPLSPSLVGISSPPQATSGLAGPGARRATNTTAGNITTGLPLEEKDKGPNKGDILNGAVSWCRDLMWLLDKYVSRQEELIEYFNDRGETMPFSITDDERRMTSELMVAMRNSDSAEDDKKHFTYSRSDGSGLRVPDYTDYKGDPLNGSQSQMDSLSLLDDGRGIIQHDLNQADFWAEDDGGDMELKEEDEFMDLS